MYDLKEVQPHRDKMYIAQRDYIIYGYRSHPNMNWCLCSSTLFMIHCETFNVWTHLLSAIYFAWQLVLVAMSFGQKQDLTSGNLFVHLATEENKIIQFIAGSSILFTMTASAFYH